MRTTAESRIEIALLPIFYYALKDFSNSLLIAGRHRQRAPPMSRARRNPAVPLQEFASFRFSLWIPASQKRPSFAQAPRIAFPNLARPASLPGKSPRPSLQFLAGYWSHSGLAAWVPFHRDPKRALRSLGPFAVNYWKSWTSPPRSGRGIRRWHSFLPLHTPVPCCGLVRHLL